MVNFIFAFIGFGCGWLAMYIAIEAKRRNVEKLRHEHEMAARQNHQQLLEIQGREKHFVEEMQQKRAELTQQLQDRLDKLREHEKLLTEEIQKKRTEDIQQLQERLAKFREHEKQLSDRENNLATSEKEFESRVISYKELRDENGLLKVDLRNIAINCRKLELDHNLQQQSQAAIATKVEEIGARYLKENVKWIGNSLNANNFAACKQRLQDVIERCRGIGYQVSKQEEDSYIADLKAEFEKVVRAAFEREEQARIKAQIREEQKLEREIQREQARIDRERTVLQEALARALATAADEHSAEIESLRARLAEAEAKQRAISQAQLTKAGFVYVISNIGSFGENIFKIGMTRRLEPLDRVRELGDASVPFPFDVHMMISCTNAPTLENALHRRLCKQQVNKTNPRKEFFRADMETIVQIVKEHHGEVHYVADAEALQYRQSLEMSDEDMQFIDRVYDELEDENEVVDEELSQPVPSDRSALSPGTV